MPRFLILIDYKNVNARLFLFGFIHHGLARIFFILFLYIFKHENTISVINFIEARELSFSENHLRNNFSLRVCCECSSRLNLNDV